MLCSHEVVFFFKYYCQKNPPATLQMTSSGTLLPHDLTTAVIKIGGVRNII